MKNKSIVMLGLFLALGITGPLQAANFAAPTAYELGGTESHNLTVVDVNQDGFLDVVAATGGENVFEYTPPKVHFLLGDGSGGLFKDNSLNVNGNYGLKFADFNGDGKLDLAAASVRYHTPYWGNNQHVITILLGQGGQTPRFLAKGGLVIGTSSSFRSASWGMMPVDYDGDGDIDLLYTGIQQDLSDASVALGNGDGTFALPVPASGVAPLAGEIRSRLIAARPNAAAADMNGDGVLDRIFVNGTSVRVDLMKTDDTVLSSQTMVSSVPGSQILARDVDNDGQADVVVSAAGTSQVCLMRGLGDGKLQPCQNVEMTGGANPLVIGDFDQDGWVDFARADAPSQQDASLWVALQQPGTTGDMQSPTVSFTAPADGAILSNQASLRVNASDNVGVIRVEFYANGNLLGNSAGPNFTFSWDTTQEVDGPYALMATAWDAAGNSKSTTINVQVDNSKPTITSVPGNNSQVSLGSTYSYHVLASGQGPFTYSLPQAPAGMTVDGNGVIRWTPDASQLGPNPVTVQVANAAGVGEQTFTVNVVDTTPPQTPTNLHVVRFIDTKTVEIAWDAATDDAAVAGYRLYFYRPKPRGIRFPRWKGGYVAVKDYTTLSAVVDRVLNLPYRSPAYPATTTPITYAVAAFDASGNVSPRSASITVGVPPRVGHDPAATVEKTIQESGYFGGSQWKTITYYLGAVGQPFTHTLKIGTGDAPVSLSLVSGPTGMVLNGNVLQWTPVPGQEGDGTVTVRATNDMGGFDYTFNYRVTAAAVNTAPVVTLTNPPWVTIEMAPDFASSPANSAKPITIRLADYVKVTDDGLPGGTLTYRWTVSESINHGSGVFTSRPMTVTNPNSLDATVTLTGVGNYSVDLEVSDGDLTTFGGYTIVAKWPNQPPLLNLFTPSPFASNYPMPVEKLAITLPTNQVNLFSYVNDEEIGTAGIRYKWSLVSGPGTAAFSVPSGTVKVNFPDYYNLQRQIKTVATFSAAGVYKIRLTATDVQGLSSSRVYQVTVNPEPAPPPPPTGPAVEFQGSIEAVTTDGVVVNGTAIHVINSTTVKFEDGFGSSFQVGQPIQGKGVKNPDGSVTATTIQIG